jgi:D-proline reductase (dithiol) PrdB
MRRTLNRLLSKLYTRAPWLPRLYARLATIPGVMPRGSSSPGPMPWAEVRMPLERATVALVTMAGVHLASQPPFDMDNPEGDASFRLIPSDVAPAALTITHDYYDHAAAERDVNVVFPYERLRELAGEGRIGRVAPFHIGAMGHILGKEERRLVQESAPAIASRLREGGADYVLIAPG